MIRRVGAARVMPPGDLTFGDARVFRGDCLGVLKRLPDESVDAVVTDPPAGVSFMGREWDHHKGGMDEWVTWLAEVMTEVHRVLKPGGHGLVWALPRTSHWTGMALERAGFEVRDCITHLFGSGFPKSLSVAKALQAMADTGSSSPSGQRRAAMGRDYAPTPLAGTPGYGVTGNFSNPDTGNPGLAVTDPVAAEWEGWGTALKPASEMWWLIRKPFKGNVANNVLTHGTGALNIDGTRVGVGTGEVTTVEYPDIRGNNYGQDREAYAERGTVTRQVVNKGRWPTNVVLTHTPECVEVGERKVKSAASTEPYSPNRTTTHTNIYANGKGLPLAGADVFGYADADGNETVPVYECEPGCPVAELDRQSGGASRFFPVFQYQAKAPAKERPTYTKPDGTVVRHVTVKSLSLMEWLVRLVTPPGGLVLDPFAGSGTTLQAALNEGFKVVGIEREADYIELIKARLEAYDEEAS